MKRFALIPAVFLVLAACADTPTSPAADLEPQFGATTDMVRFESGPNPVAGTILCTGEPVTGWQASKGHMAFTANNNGYRGQYHSQYQLELEGVTGRKYNGQGVTNEKLHLEPGLDQMIRTHNKLIAQGEDGGDDDFFFTQLIRLHITPNGDIQQDIVETTFECK